MGFCIAILSVLFLGLPFMFIVYFINTWLSLNLSFLQVITIPFIFSAIIVWFFYAFSPEKDLEKIDGNAD
jgi:hypothetical protein